MEIRIHRRWRAAAAASLALVLTGCSSPFVGTWRASNVTTSAGTVGDLELRIKRDGTYSAMLVPKSGMKKGSTGDWQEDREKTIRLVQHSGDGPRVTTAELVEKRTLQVTGEGFAERLKKE